MPKVLIYDVFLETFYEKSEGNIYEILRSMRYKNREKYAQKKKTITQNNILVIRQFIIVYGVAIISLFIVKITRGGK